MDNREALKLVNLSSRYNDDSEYVIEDISFTVNRGDFVLLTGPSGCGKSTLLKSINGVLHGENRLRGDILIDGIDCKSMSATDRSRYIGSVLQNADEQIIYEKVEDELAFPLENMAVSPEKMPDIIERFSKMMEIKLDDKTNTLSGGQKQRLITAATLCMGQKILIFDEPLANLDNEGAVVLLKNLRQLCDEEGYSVLFVEHRIDLIMEYCDRVFWMDAGSISLYETLADFKVFMSKRSLCGYETIASNPNIKEPIFELENLTYSVKQKKILKGITYKFMKGGKYVISGHNGSGKSTLINVLAGFYKPTSGSIKSYTDDLSSGNIGVVLQNPNYQLFMSTVRDELEFQSKSDEFLEYLIENFSLSPILDRHPQSLSEGQKRRLGVAVILSMLPDVLILDEPSVGQDYLNMNAMISAISKLCEEKDVTVISVSHDLRCSNNLGDVFIEMADGRML